MLCKLQILLATVLKLFVFISYSKSKRKDSRASGESEEDEPAILRAISYDPDGEADDTEGDNTDSNLEMFDIDSGNGCQNAAVLLCNYDCCDL